MTRETKGGLKCLGYPLPLPPSLPPSLPPQVPPSWEAPGVEKAMAQVKSIIHAARSLRAQYDLKPQVGRGGGREGGRDEVQAPLGRWVFRLHHHIS
jgi:hypothetical protein